MSHRAGEVMQIAYVVKDMEQSLEHWLQKMKVGPFFLLNNLEVVDPRYRGEPTDLDINIALGYSGGVCVELIKQNCDSPSVYRELLDSKGEGFHHWGVFSDRFDEDEARYRQQGHETAFSGRVAIGARYAYMDTVANMGGMIELIEATPNVRELFGNLESAALDWDGSDPIRLVK